MPTRTCLYAEASTDGPTEPPRLTLLRRAGVTPPTPLSLPGEPHSPTGMDVRNTLTIDRRTPVTVSYCTASRFRRRFLVRCGGEATFYATRRGVYAGGTARWRTDTFPASGEGPIGATLDVPSDATQSIIERSPHGVLQLARCRRHDQSDHAARRDRGGLPAVARRHRPHSAVPQHQARHRGRISHHDAALRKARDGAGRGEMRPHPSARRATLHGARPQGRSQDRR